MRQKFEHILNPEFSKVKTALESLQLAPEIDPEILKAGRRDFLAEARALSVQAVAPVSTDSRKKMKAQHRGWMAWNFKRASLMALVKIILIAGLLFGGTVGTVSASQHSLPGSALYPVKLHLEDWRFSRAQTPLQSTHLAMSYAQTRVDEAVALSNRGDDVPDQLADRYQMHIATAIQASGTLTEPLRQQTQAQVAAQLGTQLRVMEPLMLRQGHDDAGPVRAMVRVMQQAREQMSGASQAAPGRNDAPGNPESPAQHAPAQGPGSQSGVCGELDECGGDGKNATHGSDNEAPGPHGSTDSGNGNPPEEKGREDSWQGNGPHSNQEGNTDAEPDHDGADMSDGGPENTHDGSGETDNGPDGVNVDNPPNGPTDSDGEETDPNQGGMPDNNTDGGGTSDVSPGNDNAGGSSGGNDAGGGSGPGNGGGAGHP